MNPDNWRLRLQASGIYRDPAIPGCKVKIKTGGSAAGAASRPGLAPIHHFPQQLHARDRIHGTARIAPMFDLDRPAEVVLQHRCRRPIPADIANLNRIPVTIRHAERLRPDPGHLGPIFEIHRPRMGHPAIRAGERAHGSRACADYNLDIRAVVGEVVEVTAYLIAISRPILYGSIVLNCGMIVVSCGSNPGPSVTYGNLYPTQISEAGGVRNFSLAHDPTTGLLQTVTDIDNCAGGCSQTSYGYDAVGRVITASDGNTSTVLRETQYTYNDSSLTVENQTDLKIPGAGGLAKITTFDQLGQTTQTQQTDTAVPYITQQHYYTYSGSSRWEATSNPYRTASSDTTMGWTLTQYDQMNRPVCIQTIAGATAPSVSSPPACPATGAVKYAYNGYTWSGQCAAGGQFGVYLHLRRREPAGDGECERVGFDVCLRWQWVAGEQVCAGGFGDEYDGFGLRCVWE